MVIRFPFAIPLALGILTAAPTAASAQLSLRDALRAADARAYANRIAAGTATAERARALAPLKGILPSVRLESGFVRSNDPLAAFASTLRQREVTPAAFDPERLNYPAPTNNFTAGAVAEVPLVNADAWAGRRAARSAADASDARATWTRLATRTSVIQAFYGAVLAAEKALTLESAARAARAHVDQADAMVREGLVTKSDALLARVRAGEIDAQLLEAHGAAATARRQLAVLLGQSGAEAVTVPAALPPADRIREVTAGDTASLEVGDRADLAAADAGHEAARGDLRRARATLLPRVNSFARYDWNDAGRAFGGGRAWTVGVMAALPIFSGASELADIQGATARAATARAGLEAARATALLEQEQTRTALVVALQRLVIAEQGAAQATEAHRLVTRRYRGGLATAAELLDAQATETGSALGLSHARYAVIAAAAERRQALGGDPAALAVLDDTRGIAAR